MFTFPVSIMASRNPNPWAGWTGVANGSDYVADTSESFGSMTIQAINPTQFMMFPSWFNSRGVGCYGYIGTINGASVSYSARQVLPPINMSVPMSICQLDENFFIVAYLDDNSGFVCANLISVPYPTATSINVYPQTVIDNNSYDELLGAMQIVSLTTTTALLFYYDINRNCQALVLTHSGSSIIFGTPTVIGNFSTAKFYSMTAMSSTQVVLTGFNSSETDVVALGITISGTTISSVGALTFMATAGAGYQFAGQSLQTNIGSGGGGIVSYVIQQSASPSSQGMGAVYFTVSGNVITNYTPVQTIAPYSAFLTNLWISALNNVDIMIIWTDGTNIYGKILILAGNIIETITNPVIIEGGISTNSEAQWVIASQITPTTVAFGYLNNNSYPFAKILKSS